MGMRRDSCSSEAQNFALRASLLMARQSPVSKDAGFLHAIIERDSLAHGNAQGFVFKRSEELCPAGKPPYGAPKPRSYEICLAAHHASHDGEKYQPRQQSDSDGYQKHEDIGYGKSFFMVMGSVLRSNYKR